MQRLQKPRSAILVIALITGICGCGGGGSGKDPAAVVKTYLQALASGDGQKGCAQLTAQAQRALAAKGAAVGANTCPDALSKASQQLNSDQKSKLQSVKIGKASISGDTATVTINGATRPAHLMRVGGNWYITNAGA